ncbi:MAG: hypothetical protein E6356_06835 [Terrisporobacter othiniensis]|uniref:hypothetical protein n=1 Tax=Terrisporobacter petrolearius TaxID=1460447 RepID=UPI0022E4ACC9|nr:hypothetical protein [Terrisporobacter petrolearius]MDU4860692.1 hypothetical protein [Terrisporobacter othiniensis]MDU6994551.1 hypothetical protein [Terrisporobacter othiniensis]
MKIKNKIIVVILILISIFICFNLYINSHKKVTKIDKYFKNAILVEGNAVVNHVDIKINGTLSDTHFIYRYLKFSEELKGTVSIGDKNYYVTASSVTKDGVVQGILTKEKDELISDYEISFSKDLDEICIYKGNYIISGPAKSLDEAINIYKAIVDIPIN